MIRFIITRLLNGVVLLFAVATIAFFLLYWGAGDIARQILGASASQETVDLKAEQLGLNEPVFSRYGEWLSNAIHGDLGASWFTNQPVTEAITSRMGVTLSIVIGTVILTAIVATILGVSAARYGGWRDRTLQVVSILGLAIPGFLIAIFLVRIFAIELGWLNATGYIDFTDSFTGWLKSVTLPIIALSIGAMAAVAQQVRGAVKDAMRQDWVRTLRSRGISENRVVYKHVLRNASGPALAILALQFVGLLGGAVIVEKVFAIPGIGQISVTATTQGDLPIVMGIVVFTAALVVVINLSIDLLLGFVNPKVRLS
ncbi:ABC transporter permease [Demequina aurantiaca]|uniref:ABC transporter permease n=1 Tax=Demequina aurantiaca TaxID=676200 RepID=UPI0007855D0A|nr:ABC transporter permease [Demequina aurantiaca]